MFSLFTIDSREINKVNRINKKVVQRIRYKEYADAVFSGGLIRHNMKRIQNKFHRIGTHEVCKISLSCFDNKRLFLMIVSIVWLIFINMC